MKRSSWLLHRFFAHFSWKIAFRVHEIVLFILRFRLSKIVATVWMITSDKSARFRLTPSLSITAYRNRDAFMHWSQHQFRGLELNVKGARGRGRRGRPLLFIPAGLVDGETSLLSPRTILWKKRSSEELFHWIPAQEPRVGIWHQVLNFHQVNGQWEFCRSPTHLAAACLREKCRIKVWGFN